MLGNLKQKMRAIYGGQAVSDTPRTDAEAGEAVFTESGCAADVVNADFARQLERELSAAQAKLAAVEKLHADAIEQWKDAEEKLAAARPSEEVMEYASEHIEKGYDASTAAGKMARELLRIHEALK